MTLAQSFDANGSPIPAEDILAAAFAVASPRVRQLDVRDDHLLYLLTLVGDDLLRTRKLGVPAPLVALEMQAAINAMVTS